LLSKINYANDLFLKGKIETRLHIIANQLLSNFLLIKDNYPIEYQITYIDEIKSITPKVHLKADGELSEIYFEKGDLLLKNENYEEAYSYYLKANMFNSSNTERIKMKTDHLLVALLNNVYNLLQNKDNLLAYEKLHFAKNISSVSSKNIDFLMDFVENQISNSNHDKIRQRMINLIQDKQEFITSYAKEDIYLGDLQDDVINILGIPVERIHKVNFENYYSVLIYEIKDKKYKFFFKNQILIDVERN
jgi:tetratricopeptide (TPR) repeat protein